MNQYSQRIVSTPGKQDGLAWKTADGTWAGPVGEMSFVVNGVMIGGFALVAAPANYRVTGVKTFVVSNTGIVYQKDLGPSTLDQFHLMERTTPTRRGRPWRRTDAPSRGTSMRRRIARPDGVPRRAHFTKDRKSPE